MERSECELTATNQKIFEELAQLTDQNTSQNELLVTTHNAGQTDREATRKKEMRRRRRDKEHKNELQLTEARWEAQIAELKLHRKTLHAEILGREVSNHTDINTSNNTSNITEWKKVAEGLTEFRSSKNLQSNESLVRRIFAENDAFLAPILAICPNVEILLANVLTNATSFKINKAWVYPSQNSDISPLQDLTEEEAARLGKSFRKHLLANKEFAVAVDAWRLANTTLQPLFDHSPVFGSIMLAVAKVCVRDFYREQMYLNLNLTKPLNSFGSLGAAPSRVVQHGARKTRDIGRSSLNHGYDH